MKATITSLIALTLALNIFAEGSKAPPTATATFMKNPQKGGLKLNGAGNLHAGHYGLLLVAENGGSIVAIDTKDTGAFKSVKPVKNLSAKIAGAIGNHRRQGHNQRSQGQPRDGHSLYQCGPQ